MEFIKPNRLKKGDTVAIISPSAGLPSLFPHIYEEGIRFIESLGLKVKEYPTARMDMGKLYENPELRAKDINDAFKDNEVKAIFASIGGEDSVRILPYLDKDVIVKNPKIIMGYSDSSTFLMALNKWGLVTFSGPSVMAGLAQGKTLPEAFKKHIEGVLMGDTKDYQYQPYSQYHDGYPDWADVSNTGKLHEAKATDGWHFIQGRGVVKGYLYGGSLEVAEFIKATDYWPDKDFWKDKILFLETSEGKPSPKTVKYILRNYGAQGALNQIQALLFGRARDYTDDEKKELEEVILQIAKEFDAGDLVVVTNMDFGHTDPQIILPLGIKAQVDCGKQEFKLLESATQ